MRNSAVVLTLLAGTILLPPLSHADEYEARVARVSYVNGDVSYQRGDVEGWNDLRVNTPLVTGDAFYASDGGRVEVNLGSGVVVRLDGGTEVNLVNNSSDVSQLSLTSGVLDIRARSFPRGFTLEIDTPSGAVTILEPGRYRVAVDDRVATYAVVRGGMSLALDGEQLDVREGESLELENSDSPSYAYGSLSAPTPFQRWADDRDFRIERSASARYVNNDVVGYEDLDDHGSWRDSREYGRVWSPSGMSANWAPYQAGRWIWQDPYGWTWVSDESWGWAPYHYGRWIRADNDWCWVPPPPRGYRGPSVVLNIQPVYAPALVGFIGGRNWGLSLSIGGPAIGWVPLAPRERYYYPWQSAPRVTNNYTNITVNNAVTIVNYNTFGTQAVRPIRVERAQLERAPVIGFTAVGVVPGRASLVVSAGGDRRASAIPQVRTERPIVARLVPPPRPQQFAQKVAEIERTGRPVARRVAIEPAVGKPFVPGAPAPVGVKAFSAAAPSGRKQMQARPGAEARGPKRFERDIAPPAPRGNTVPVAERVAPPPVSQPPARTDPRQASPNDAKSNWRNGNAAARPDPATPAPETQVPPNERAKPTAAPPAAVPEARPEQAARPGRPDPRQASPNDANSKWRNRNPAARPDPATPAPETQVPPNERGKPTAAPAPAVPEARPERVARPVRPDPPQAAPNDAKSNWKNRNAAARPNRAAPEPETQAAPSAPPRPDPQAPVRQTQPAAGRQRAPDAPAKPAVVPPAVAPEATPERVNRHAPPAPRPAVPPAVEKETTPVQGQAKPPQADPRKKRKWKDKNAPEPPPEPPPAPPSRKGV